MKKIITAVLVSILIIVSSVPSYADNIIGVTIDNKPVTFDIDSGYPFIDSSRRTLVPLRQTMEAAGYAVTWDSKNDVATVSDNSGTKVYVKIGDNYITKEINNNGTVETSRIKNDTYAQVVNHRTYLPIRAVLECFGASVSWNSASHNVIINSSGISSTFLSAEEVYSKYSSAVFYIEIYDASGEAFASGSGFFISNNGTAITNYHVIEGASKAKVTTTDGKTYDVEGVYDYDETLDLAKIKVNGSNFNYVHIANPCNVTGGSKAYAIGSPLGLSNTISEGVVSNPNRIIENKTYYQITTPISSGSSGGALFDKNGNIIGITCGGFEGGQNLNLAIPITNINTLTGTSVSKLSTISSHKTNKTISFTASKNNVSLKTGENTSIILSVDDPEAFVSDNFCYFHINDESIVSGTWGDWNENGTLPLYIEGLKPGQTTIEISIIDSDANVLEGKTIHVSVSQGYTTPYYAGYYPVPDLGKIFGVPVYDSLQSYNSVSFFYNSKDLDYVSPNSDFIVEYSDIVMKNGFSFCGEFYDTNNNDVLYYRNNYYGLTLYTSFEYLNGTLVYFVVITKD